MAHYNRVSNDSTLIALQSYGPLSDSRTLDVESLQPYPPLSDPQTLDVRFLQPNRRKPDGAADAPYRPRTQSRHRTRKLILSYTPDWAGTFVLAGASLALGSVVIGYKRTFSLSDTSLQYPFVAKQHIPDIAAYIISVIPIVLQWIYNLIAVRSWWDAHTSALGTCLGLGLTGAITQIVRITVGRPRPDTIARCNPDTAAVDPPFKMYTAAICRHPISLDLLDDAFRSFPSGHASSFAGLGFLSFYMAGQMHLFDGRGYVLKSWLAFTPLTVAALVAISRTLDYRHHWEDVTVGAILGLSLAYFAYRQYYPSLSHKYSHQPYPPRIDRDDADTAI